MKIIVYHDDLKIEWKGFKKREEKKSQRIQGKHRR